MLLRIHGGIASCTQEPAFLWPLRDGPNPGPRLGSLEAKSSKAGVLQLGVEGPLSQELALVEGPVSVLVASGHSAPCVIKGCRGRN